ncbi:MAG: MarR family transcriptional regulator [Nitrososphaerota archaeon]|jgi:Mn-dependent DtxR family transcriptional regulator|nr:MarR family transcriptional regulator [Nitrososphaerota archaeon]MDG6942841.1 MarR family transcriptional regulator [Nitrososphaerota archaeon]MDG6950839.1 MarR family transcriptional regulator [Nitrososphaerota archaeon]
MAALIRSGKDVSRVEDYLEAIYSLNEEKGYVSAADISERLAVKPPTVSNMIRNLADKGFLEHERYRGMRLTPSGEKVARSVIKRHEVISTLISMLGVDDTTAFVDTEGIEHHVHPSTLRKFERLAEFLRDNPKILKEIREYSGD